MIGDSRPVFPAVLGTSDARALVEPSLRGLVADHLGVDVQALGAGVSLREDLAADSLDLLELTLLLEREFALTVSDRALDGIVSYGDLVDVMVDLVVERARDQRRTIDQAPQFRSHLAQPEGVSQGIIACAGLLTPYTAEMLAQDARVAGSAAQLDIAVARGTTDVAIARLSDRCAPLAARGVSVDVRRDDQGVANGAAVAAEPSAATA
jgi:acyl carrier protein